MPRTVELSDEAYAVVCGLVQPTTAGVNAAGIFSDAWDELRREFPLDDFHAFFDGRDESGPHHDPEAGT